MKPFNKYELKEPDNKTEDSTIKNKEQSSGRYNEKEDAELNEKHSSARIIEPSNRNVTSKQLQEAIIWSEILGKPLCKRRKRR
jgi:hypothetical protein